jgi:hypothetical protein
MTSKEADQPKGMASVSSYQDVQDIRYPAGIAFAADAWRLYKLKERRYDKVDYLMPRSHGGQFITSLMYIYFSSCQETGRFD